MVIDEDILFYAFRYALGRSTYVVSDVVLAILRNWKELGEDAKQLMKKEILEYRERNGLCGMQMDDDEWQKILDKC
jgi:hypothetical protein